MESFQDFDIVISKIIKTSEVLQIVEDLESKNAKLKQKYKQSIDDKSILKHMHEVKCYQYEDQSMQIEKLKADQEKLTNEYSSLKLSHDKQLNELVNLQMKYQTVCQDFNDYHKSEEKFDLIEPEKKRRKLNRKQKLIKTCDYSSADDFPNNKVAKYNRTIPSEDERIKIEVLGTESNVEQQPLNNFQISFNQEELQAKNFNEGLLEELDRCREEKSAYKKASEEREMKMHSEWREKEERLKSKIKNLQETIQHEKSLVKNSEMKEVEMKKKWEDKERILRAKIVDLEGKIQEEKSLARRFEEKISYMKKEWLEKDHILRTEIEVMKARADEEKLISLKNLDMKVEWHKKEQELKMKISNLKEKIDSLQREKQCEKNFTLSPILDDSMKNENINESEPLDKNLIQYDEKKCHESSVRLNHLQKQGSMKLPCLELNEDSVDNEIILDILKEMRISMISPIPELKHEEEQIIDKAASKQIVSVSSINITDELKNQIITEDMTVSPVTEQITSILTTNITDDSKHQIIVEDNIVPPASIQTDSVSTIKITHNSNDQIQEEPKQPDWSDRYRINRRKKEKKYHMLSTIKKAKQKFWLGLGQTFIFNEKCNRKPVKQKRKTTDKNGSTLSTTPEMTAGSSNTLVNGIATVFADLVSQRLNNSRLRVRSMNERNVLEINKMLLEEAKKQKETKNLFKIENLPMDLELSSCDETLLKENEDQSEVKECDMNKSAHNRSRYETHSSGVDTPNFVDSCYESNISNPPSIKSFSKDNMMEDKKGNPELEPQCNDIINLDEKFVPVDNGTVENINNLGENDVVKLIELETKSTYDDMKSNSPYSSTNTEIQSAHLQDENSQIPVSKKTEIRRSPRIKKPNIESSTINSLQRSKRIKSVEMPTQKYNLRNRTKSKVHLKSDGEQIDQCYDDLSGKCNTISSINRASNLDTSTLNNSAGTAETGEIEITTLKSMTPNPQEMQYHTNNILLKSDEEKKIDDFNRYKNSITEMSGMETSTVNGSCETTEIPPKTENNYLKSEVIQSKQGSEYHAENKIYFKSDEEIYSNCGVKLNKNSVNKACHIGASSSNTSPEIQCISLKSEFTPILQELQYHTKRNMFSESDEENATDQRNNENINSINEVFHAEEKSLNSSSVIEENSPETICNLMKSAVFPIPQELKFYTEDSESDEEEETDQVHNYFEEKCYVMNTHNEVLSVDAGTTEPVENYFKTNYNSLKSEFMPSLQEVQCNTSGEIYLRTDEAKSEMCLQSDDEEETDQCHDDFNGKCKVINSINEAFHMEASAGDNFTETRGNFSETKNNLLNKNFTNTNTTESSGIKPNLLKSEFANTSNDSSESKFNFFKSEYTNTLNNSTETSYSPLKSESVSISQELQYIKSNICLESDAEEETDQGNDDFNGKCEIINSVDEVFHLESRALNNSSESKENFSETKYNLLRSEFTSTLNNSSGTTCNLLQSEVTSSLNNCSPSVETSPGTNFNLLKSGFTCTSKDSKMIENTKLKSISIKTEVTPIAQETQCHLRSERSFELNGEKKIGRCHYDLNEKCNTVNSMNETLHMDTSTSKNYSETIECSLGIEDESEVIHNSERIQYETRTSLESGVEKEMDQCHGDINVKFNNFGSTCEPPLDVENSPEPIKNLPEANDDSVKSEIRPRPQKRKRPPKGTLMARSMKIYRVKNSAITVNKNFQMGSSSKCDTNIPVISNPSIENKCSNSSCGSTPTTQNEKYSLTVSENTKPFLDHSELPLNTINNSTIPNNLQNNSLHKNQSPVKAENACSNTPLGKKRKVRTKVKSDIISDCTVPNVQKAKNPESPISTSNLAVKKNSPNPRKIVPSQLESSKINIIQDIILKSKNKNNEQKTGGFKRPLASKILPPCPQSPPPLTQEESVNTFEPLIIPLDKPTKINPDKAASLFRKLITYSNEDKSVEEVARNFCNQEVDYISSLILEQIIQDKEKPDATVPRAPLMTHTQRVMFGFMLKLEKMNVCNLINTYLKTSELYLIKTDALEPVECVTRLYVAICKSHGYIERIRRFCLDAFYFMGDFAIPFLFTALISWIEVLPPAKDSRSFPLVKVLIQLINLKTCNKPGYNLLPLKELIHKFYEYPNEYTNSDNFFQELFSNYLKNPVAPNDFAILLYCKNNECKWVYQKIDTLLKPILPNIKNANFKATLIILIGNIVNQFTGKLNTEYVKSIREWLKDMTKEEDIPEIVVKSTMYAIRKLPKIFKKTGNQSIIKKEDVQIVNKINM